MAGVARAAIGSMNIVDHVLVAVKVTANAIGRCVHLSSMVIGLGVSGEVLGNRVVAIIAVAGGPRLTCQGRPFGAGEGGD